MLLSCEIENFVYYFEISGKYACIKEIRRKVYDDNRIRKIVIPSEVHYGGYTYIVNAISGYTTQEKRYRRVTNDRRRKDYDKIIEDGTYESKQSMIGSLNEKFEWCGGEIILPNTICEIGPLVVDFDGCRPNIKLNDGLKFIRAGAFSSYHNRTINIPSSVKIIEDLAFCNCKNLKLIIDNEPGAVKIGEKAIATRDVLYSICRPSDDFEIIYLRPKTSWLSKLINKL